MIRRFIIPIVVAPLVFWTTKAPAATINFSEIDTLEAISALGVNISGSGEIDFSSGGLGVDGSTIENGEFVLFDFDGLAGNVVAFSTTLVLDDFSVIPGNGLIEGFDVGGSSLGVVTLNAFTASINISELFNNQLLGAFSYTALDGTGRNISELSFERVVIEAPEPGFILGLVVSGGLAVASKRRRK